MLRRAVDHRRHFRTHATPKATANIDQSRRMKRPGNRTEDKIRRSRCRLRALRHGRITSSKSEKLMARENHHPYRPKTGQGNDVLSPKGVVLRLSKIGPMDDPRYKSP